MGTRNWKRMAAAVLMIVMVFSIVISAYAAAGTWKKDSKGWWYKYSEGGYPKAAWEKIDGKWYHFNGSGYMQTGWLKDGGKWYYLGTNGAMTTGWQKVSGKWYYMRTNGVMTTGWKKVSGKWYYMSSSGVMKTGWLKSGGKWYYLGTNGAMVTGWKKISGDWYYMNSSGVMQTGWLKSGGKTYYLGSTGIMLTGKQTIGGKTYTFDSNGVLQQESDNSAWSEAYKNVLLNGHLNDFEDKSSYLNYNKTHKGTALYDLNNDGIPELLLWNGVTGDFNFLLYTYPDNLIYELSNMGTVSYDPSRKTSGIFNASRLSSTEPLQISNITYDGTQIYYKEFAKKDSGGTVTECFDSDLLDAYENSKVLPKYSISDINSMGWNAFLAKYGY